MSAAAKLLQRVKSGPVVARIVVGGDGVCLAQFFFQVVVNQTKNIWESGKCRRRGAGVEGQEMGHSLSGFRQRRQTRNNFWILPFFLYENLYLITCSNEYEVLFEISKNSSNGSDRLFRELLGTKLPHRQTTHRNGGNFHKIKPAPFYSNGHLTKFVIRATLQNRDKIT